jgi:hypothetical protein
MIFRRITLAAFLLMGGSAYGQATFQKYFGSESTLEKVQDFYVGENDDIAVLGETYMGGPSSSSAQRAFLSLTDSNGNIRWSRFYHNEPSDRINEYELYPRHIYPVENGGWLLAGPAIGRSSAFFIIKTDKKGRVIWSKLVDAAWYESALCKTLDGHFTMVINRVGPGRKFWFDAIKFNSQGTVLWARSYATPYSEIRAICATSDGGFTVAGAYSDDTISQIAGPLIAKMNEAGDLEWAQLLQGSGSIASYVSSVSQHPARGDIMFTGTMDVGGDGWPFVGGFKADGSKQWFQRIDPSMPDSSLYYQTFSIAPSRDGLYLMANAGSNIDSLLTDNYITVSHLSNTGDVSWSKMLTSSRQDMGFCIKADSRNRFIAGGWAINTGAFLVKGTGKLQCLDQKAELRLVQFDGTDMVQFEERPASFSFQPFAVRSNYLPTSMDATFCSENADVFFYGQPEQDTPEEEGGFLIYPNPTRHDVKIRFYLDTDSPVGIRLTDMLGRHISTLADQPMYKGHHEFSFNFGQGLTAGTYLLSFQTNSGERFEKLVVY